MKRGKFEVRGKAFPLRCLVAASLGVAAGAAGANQGSQDNQKVLDAWAQTTGGAAPAVVAQPDGSTRLEWQVQTSAEAYGSRVSTAGEATINSPLQDGDRNKTSMGFVVKGTGGQATPYLQGALLATNDRAVLGKYDNQLSTLQAGYLTPTWQVMAGDVAANYSSLSSNLGLRGLMGQARVGALSLSTHAGTIAESWEALLNRGTLTGAPPRTAFLRDVYGAKLDYEVMQGVRLFATTQGYSDREGSLSTAVLPAAETRSSTAGVAYQGQALSLSLEAGGSRFGVKGQDKRAGNALVFAAVYKAGAVTWRAGRNDIGPLFASLAAAAAPGVEETYLGADWLVSPTLTLGAEARSGANKVASTEISEATRSPFDALVLRGTIGLGKWIEGSSLQLMEMRSNNETPLGQTRENRNTSIGFNFSRAGWVTNFGVARNSSEDASNPNADSTTRSVQASLGRSWSGMQGNHSWVVSANALINRQVQSLKALGSETRSNNIGLTFMAQHQGWGTLNMAWQTGKVTQPMGGPDLDQRAFQLDASYPLTRIAALRAYWRWTERNAGVDSLKTTERVGGANVTLNF